MNVIGMYFLVGRPCTVSPLNVARKKIHRIIPLYSVDGLAHM